MTPENLNIWPKRITVDKRIVNILSVATYENFPQAIKEIITNSYDADSTKVDISINTKNEIITIVDNGFGMDDHDFEFYLRIAYRQREKTGSTQNNRKIIGQFGVGFLAIFPFCLNYEIESKKKGSDEIMFAQIPTAKYFTQENKLIDVSDIYVNGGIRKDSSKKNLQYTIITLKGFSDLTKEFFKEKKSDYAYSIINYKPLDILKWHLTEDLPLEYESNDLNMQFNDNLNYPFEVAINGLKLFRRIYGDTILEKSDNIKQIGNIKYKYFVCSNFKPVQPPEGRGFKIRNLNVGVGPRTAFGIGIEGRTYSSNSYISGEIHVIEGLNNFISLKRDDFNFNQDYEQLKDEFRKKIREWSDTLEQIRELSKTSRDTENDYRLVNLNFLDPPKITKILNTLSNKGFSIKKGENLSTLDSAPFQINKKDKEIIISKDLSSFQKKIYIKDKLYNIKIDSWDTSDELYAACKLNHDTIIINKSYKLFSGRKYLDVFFKIHALLLVEFENKNINKQTYLLIIRDLINIFENY